MPVSDWICGVCLDIQDKTQRTCKWGCDTVNPTLEEEQNNQDKGDVNPNPQDLQTLNQNNAAAANENSGQGKNSTKTSENKKFKKIQIIPCF